MLNELRTTRAQRHHPVTRSLPHKMNAKPVGTGVQSAGSFSDGWEIRGRAIMLEELLANQCGCRLVACAATVRGPYQRRPWCFTLLVD